MESPEITRSDWAALEPLYMTQVLKWHLLQVEFAEHLLDPHCGASNHSPHIQRNSRATQVTDCTPKTEVTSSPAGSTATSRVLCRSAGPLCDRALSNMWHHCVSEYAVHQCTILSAPVNYVCQKALAMRVWLSINHNSVAMSNKRLCPQAQHVHILRQGPASTTASHHPPTLVLVW